MKIGGTSTAKPVVAWPSLASNLPTYPSGTLLSCSVDSTSISIACTNVGGGLTAGTYWVALSVSYTKDVVVADLAGIGAV